MAPVEAADALGVGYRQAKRIWARFGRQGASGLSHAGRDRVSNRRLDSATKERALELSLLSETHIGADGS